MNEELSLPHPQNQRILLNHGESTVGVSIM